MLHTSLHHTKTEQINNNNNKKSHFNFYGWHTLYACCTENSERAYLACPSCVYCRGHHLPSVSLYISAGTHHPPHPTLSPDYPSVSQWDFSGCHITHQHVYCHSVFHFHCSQTGFYCTESLRQRALILQACFKINGTSGRHSCWVIWIQSEPL